MLVPLAFVFVTQLMSASSALEKPPHTVVTATDSYEERMYPAQKWVTTSLLSISYDDATSDMFMKLFDYIDGQNAAGVKIDMTAPVTVLVQPGEGPNCENNFTESFYIPTALQDNPPAPTNPDVYIESRPALHLYSRSFHGFAHGSDFVEAAAALAMDLAEDGVEGVVYEPYYTASYQSPYSIYNRTNEVWLLVN